MSTTAKKLKRGTDYAVLEGSRRVGSIRRRLDGWCYNPIKTDWFGKPYPTARECFDALIEASNAPDDNE